jgi:hypothetical protein
MSMSDLRPEIFEAANVESDNILDWMAERDVPFEVAALAMLITAAGMIVHASENRANFERKLADRQSIFVSAANQFFDAKEAEAATKQ